jgi:AGZA family xanthine/uracil permease-like MFS transporter
VEAGGRTGLTAVACSFYFLLAIFFAPILSSVPAWATGGALIIVGALMCRNLVKIQWDKIDHALTAFVVVMIMPLTYSIAYGLIGGLMVWCTMQLTFKIFELVGIAHPYKEESEVEDKEEKIKQEEPAKADKTQPAAEETANA